ncbi:MAG: cation transporter [Gammaproteobacteria bacterium]|nr:cation transporter [Gammaproteobacteria bacterium]
MPGCTDCSADATDRASSDPLFQRVLWIALIANLAMFFVEIVASHVGDSMSLQADALDFFSDSANYAISLFVVGMAITARAKASLFKGATMALFGIWVIGSAVYRAMTGSAPDPSMMGSIALLALVVNVSVAFLLYRYRDGDSNKQSIWLCSRNDAIGNVAVMIAAAGVFASSTRWPDLLVAGIIAALNISAALHVVRLARVELGSAQAQCELDSPTIADFELR